MSTTHQEVNWDDIRRRIAETNARVQDGFALSVEERKKILKSRAKELAREPVDPSADGDSLELVEFQLAGEHYGIKLTSVREVCFLKELTPVPCTPSFVIGIINLRGEIRTVIDLKRFFDLPHQGITELNKIIMLRGEDMELGILADEILGVRTLLHSELQPTLPTLTGIRSDYLTGVTHDRLVVLDAHRILSHSRIIVNEEVEP